MLLLQIGDLNEIMYFKARSEIERIDWMEAIRVGIIKKNSAYLPFMYSETTS